MGCWKMVVGERNNREAVENVDEVASYPVIHLPHSAIVSTMPTRRGPL
jgi:hypothetical protein